MRQNTFDDYNIDVWDLCKFSNREKYKKRHNFFAERHPLADYFGGLMLADGCAWIDTRGIRGISLKMTDKPLVYYVGSILAPDNKITVYKAKRVFSTYHNKYINNSEIYRFIVNSKKMFDDLYINYNVTPRKSKTCVPPWDVTSHEFTRGNFDGDGCVYVDETRRQPEISFCGTYAQCVHFESSIRNWLGTTEKKVYLGNGVYVVGWHAKKDFLKIYWALHDVDVGIETARLSRHKDFPDWLQ